MDIKMSPSELTLRKFCACIGLTIEDTQNAKLHKIWKYHSEAYYIENCINVDAFKKLMYMNNLEEYTMLALHQGFLTIVGSYEYLGDKDLEQENEDSKVIIKALIWLLSEEKGENTSITFQKQRGKKTIVNSVLFYPMIKGLMKEYTNSLRDRESKINLESLKIHLKTLELKYEKKSGAKRKNTSFGELAIDLSYLIRVDKFLNNRKDITDIEEIPLKDEDRKFIHDCLVIFGLIKDYSLNKENSTTPEKYINSILIQANKHNSLEHRNCINKLKSLISEVPK